MCKNLEQKEVIICKFDNEIECDEYICEEDCTSLEIHLNAGKNCPLFEMKQKRDLQVKRLRERLDKILPYCSGDGCGHKSRVGKCWYDGECECQKPTVEAKKTMEEKEQ